MNISGRGGIPLGRIELTVKEISILLPDNTVLLSPVYRLTGYDTEGEMVHVEFDPEVKLTIRYDHETIPENLQQPYFARYTDEEGVIPLESPAPPINPGKSSVLLDSSSLFMVLAEIVPQPPPLPVRFTARNLRISPHEAFEGDPVKISVIITNEGLENDTHELYLIIDGIVRAIQEVTLSGKSSKTLTFEITNLATGTHQIKIAGLTENIKLEQVFVKRSGPGVNWMALDASVAGTIMVGLFIWFLYLIRARRHAAEIGI